jgi:Carboxylesterase family
MARLGEPTTGQEDVFLIGQRRPTPVYFQRGHVLSLGHVSLHALPCDVLHVSRSVVLSSVSTFETRSERMTCIPSTAWREWFVFVSVVWPHIALRVMGGLGRQRPKRRRWRREIIAWLGTKDCFVVNVYTPVAGDPHPVLVWIHSGGAVTDSPRGHDGTLFTHHGVVDVTVGYRLGVFGLLYLPGVFVDAEGDEDTDGDFSLLDQVAALRWVRKNIAAFGGDHARVTVAGE